MARPSRTGGKTIASKTGKTTSVKSRHTGKTKHRIAPIARRLNRSTGSGLGKELKEARAQQAATAEILKVIARSPSDVDPVFEAIATNAKRLLGGFAAAVFRLFGGMVHVAAFTPTNPAADKALRADFPKPVDAFEPLALTRPGEPFAIPDTEEVPHAPIREIARLNGFRSMLFVPLMNGGLPIGVISVTRAKPGTFAPHHVQLLQTFADQAVIAIENVRLFDEVEAKTRDLSESLQQQTATADVLKVISRSAFDLQTVLDALLSSACQLCEADIGTIRYEDGENYRLAATYGCKPEWIRHFSGYSAKHFSGYSAKPDQSSVFGQTIIGGRTVHMPDVLADPNYRRPEAQKLMGFRAALGVPLIREGHTFGVINLFRFAVGSFEPRQIEIVETFADQAVIAIENVRLFDEVQARTRDLTEALTYQTGSANILKVIASSPTDVAPVLQAIVESACELCEAYDAVVMLKDGEELCVGAHHGPIPMSRLRWSNDRGSVSGRAMADCLPVHVHDMLSNEGAEFLIGREMSRVDGCHTLLGAPLLREGEAIGAILLRRAEVHPFSDKQIALLQTFADQAVIAIGNVRLFDEVQARTRDLAKSLDELRTAQDRLIQTEKLASLGQLTAGIAHEIKNPLNFINNFSALSVELLAELGEALAPAALDKARREEIDELAEMLKGNLEKVVQHGKRADSIVKNMLLHSRSGSSEPRRVEINAIIDESLNLAYHGARAEKQSFNVTLERELDPEAGMAEVFPQEITRVFLNMISNGFYAAAKRAAETGNGFEPRLKAVTRGLPNRVEIRIRDNGTGIAPEVKEKIFDPFFTTKPPGEGTGLGLSMSHDIVVKQHGGTIDVDSEPGVFTEFIITLPRTTRARESAGDAN